MKMHHGVVLEGSALDRQSKTLIVSHVCAFLQPSEAVDFAVRQIAMLWDLCAAQFTTLIMPVCYFVYHLQPSEAVDFAVRQIAMLWDFWASFTRAPKQGEAG